MGCWVGLGFVMAFSFRGGIGWMGMRMRMGKRNCERREC